MEAFDMIRTTMKEFSEVSDEEIKVYISLAEPMISKKKFGKLYSQAVAFVTAHKMKLNGLGKKIGTATIGDTIGLISVSEGETSMSFSNNQIGNIASDAEYGLTVYGMQFLSLKRMAIVPILCSGEESCYGC